VNVFTLLVLGDQLAKTDDGQLIAFLEAIAIGLDKGDLGPIDALFLDASEKFVLRAFMCLNELVPSGDLFIETGDVLERILGWNGAIEDASEVIQDLGIFGGFAAEFAVSFSDLAVERRGLIVFS